MNVYAEVRGKYARNANNTKNTVEVPCIASRPSTSGSLINYSRRSFGREENRKEVQEEEAVKSSRPLNSETNAAKKRRYKEKDNNLKETEKNVEDGKEIDKDKINEKNMDEDGIVLEEGIEDDENQKRNKDEEDDDNDNEGEIKEDADKITEVSFKTTSSQKRYIEELEQLLRDERMRRIKAEGELERLSTRHGKKHQ